MSWITQTLSSTIGKKVIMSLTGLFLCSFLVIHMAGNLQLFKGDGGQAFNEYSYFMTHNPLIKTISYLLYTSIIVHALWALLLTLYNKKARPVGYAYSKPSENSTWSSRNMGILGTILLIFIVIHMRTFWFEYHFGFVPTVTYEGTEYKDLYSITLQAFSQLWYVALYIFSMIALAFHLAHGFASGFQTLGLRHKKYTPLILNVGLAFSILIPALFAAMPIYLFFVKQ